jgi:predicted AlkP superfamily phosphohydrolase/phosphomutase
MASADRVLIIGWDSAPPDLVLERWPGELPNLRRLMSQGCYGPLRSTDPPITVPAWTSMMSSRNPGQLGFYGFRNRRVGEYEGKWIATSQAVKVPRAWEILSDAAKRCCVLNVPQTYPVKPLNGAMISCFLTPSNESEYTFPPELKAEVERVADGYIIDCEGFRTEDKRGLLEQIHAMTEKRFRVAKWLLSERGPWDFFMMVEMGPDRLHHGFWSYTDPQHRKYEPGNEFESCVLDYYKILDAQLGELVELAGPGTLVLVVSDHGTKRMEGSLNVNDWLRREGLLVLKEEPEAVTGFHEKNVDWSRTVAWAWGGYYSRIFLNVAGREPQGVVAPGEYESVRDDLARRLEAIPDDRGRKMATRALRPQELFTGPYVADAPDLFVYFDDLYWRAGQDVGHDGLHSFDTEIGPDDSVHDYQGIFVMSRPGQQRGQRLEGLDLRDVAPTVLEALGVPVPGEMEGKVVR